MFPSHFKQQGSLFHKLHKKTWMLFFYITSNMSVNAAPHTKTIKNVIVFKVEGGWRSSLRSMKCYDNTTMNMDENPQSTPSQAPMVLKSVPILISDNAVMVKQSRTARLPCHSPSHTLPPLGSQSVPAPLPEHTCSDTKMKTKTWRCTKMQTKSDKDTQGEYTVHARTHRMRLEVGFWIDYWTFAGLKSPFLYTQTQSVIEVKRGRGWFHHLLVGMKLVPSIRQPNRERRLATSCLQSYYCQSGSIHRPHRDRGWSQSSRLNHHVRPNEDWGLLDLAAVKPKAWP